jgi:hypothetical protein
VKCESCGYDLSGHAPEYRRGVTCPECGEKDAARFPMPPPEVVPLFFLSACSIVLSFVQAQGGGVASVLGAFPCIVFAVAMGCAGAWRLRDPRRTPRERWAGRAWVFATLAWAAFLVWAVVR